MPQLLRPRNIATRGPWTVPPPFTVVALCADTKSTGLAFPAMARSAIDKIPPGPKLDALTEEKVFGWRKVHKHEGSIIVRKQDKAGHWRRAKVPNYSTNPLHSYSVENRMKQLGRMDRYQKELSKVTRSKNIPSVWASPINAAGNTPGHTPISLERKCPRSVYRGSGQYRCGNLLQSLFRHTRYKFRRYLVEPTFQHNSTEATVSSSSKNAIYRHFGSACTRDHPSASHKRNP